MGVVARAGAAGRGPAETKALHAGKCTVDVCKEGLTRLEQDPDSEEGQGDGGP